MVANIRRRFDNCKSGLVQIIDSQCSLFKNCYYGSNSIVFKAMMYDDHYVFTIDKSKYLYYSYALEHKYKYIPKLYSVMYDVKHKVSLIVREQLFPVTDTKKLVRIEQIKIIIKEGKFGLDPIADEIIRFYYDESYDNNLEFDFSPHFIMQNERGKLIVCDAFIERKVKCNL